MTWIDDISQLEYNDRRASWFPCYHDVIFNPADIILQGIIPKPSSAGLDITINVLAPDGTFLEDATSYFKWFYGYASISSGTVNFYYFNLQCSYYSPQMLSNGCFVLEVILTTTGTNTVVFHQYTQAYKLGSNCIYTGNISISGDNGSLIFTDCTVYDNNSCGLNYHKFVSFFECYDQFTGDYYGLPTTILGGNVDAFEFYKITWIEGVLKYVPRNIKRTISLNCILQRSETIKQYKLLPIQTLFPDYKASEIEGMLLSNNLFLDEREYKYGGDTPFTAADKCEQEYKLTLNLQDCDTYQIFNCTPDCSTTVQMFVFQRQSPTGKYYDQSGNLIATNADELATYFKSLDRVIAVQNLTFIGPSLKYPLYAAFKVQSEGYIPNFLYAGIINPISKVYAQPIDVNSIDLSNYGGKIIGSLSCAVPTLGDIYTTDVNCAIPVIGDIYTTDPYTYLLTITEQNNWAIHSAETDASVTEGLVTFDLLVSNPGYNYTSGKHTLIYMPIGQLSVNGWPQTDQLLTPSNTANLPVGSSIRITTTGLIVYSGETTTEDGTGATVQLFGIKYNIYNIT